MKFNLFKTVGAAKHEQALSEVAMLERRIEFLDKILKDFHDMPKKYHRQIDGPVDEAYRSLLLDKTKLEIQFLYLSQFL